MSILHQTWCQCLRDCGQVPAQMTKRWVIGHPATCHVIERAVAVSRRVSAKRDMRQSSKILVPVREQWR